MDTTTLLKLMLSGASTGAVGKKTGLSANQVSGVISSVLPQLLSGAGAQASNKETSASFLNALDSHGKKDTYDLESFFGNVDTKDGEKILGHLLGANTGSAAKAAAESAGVTEKEASQVMANVAPLLMSVLGQQKAKHSATGGSELLKAVMSNSFGSLLGASKKPSASVLGGIDANDVIGILGKLMK